MTPALLLGLALAAQSPAPPTFAARTTAVYVDVFPGRDAARAPSAADFELRDNGARQQVTLAGVDDLPLTVVMVFDVSDSVRGEKLARLKRAGHALLDGLGPRDAAALITFSERVSRVVPAGAPRGAVSAALDALETGGATSLWDAVYAGLLSAPPRGGALVVLFTDGEDDMSWLSAGQVAQAAEQSNAVVYVVALPPGRRLTDTAAEVLKPGSGSATRYLEPEGVAWLHALAESSGGRLWEASGSADLEPTFLKILHEAQSRYVLSFEPSDPKAGWHRLEVKMRGRGRVRSRRGYFLGAPGQG